MSELIGPDLPDLRFIRHIGTGGFAEVFLYEQISTGQEVAVKILNEDGLDDEVAKDFFAEAKTTAKLADHPYIVSVFVAGTTPDGRPYLVMQFCPRANLAVRCRQKQFTVREVLELGIQLASAVETAHRAGILHRDIKPGNVLTDRYDAPLLTDFGIAGQTGSVAAGMSLGWSPPEVVDWQVSDERADVYSLCATLWHVLAGHSPFEVKGGVNTKSALTDRIKTMPVPAVPREDVPQSLQALLRQGMSKNALDRPASALALATRLRGIQQDLHLPLTDIRLREVEPIDVTPSTPRQDESEQDGPATIFRAPQVIDPDSDPRRKFAPRETQQDVSASQTSAPVAPAPSPSRAHTSSSQYGYEPAAIEPAAPEPAMDERTSRPTGPSKSVPPSFSDPVLVPSQSQAEPERTTRPSSSVLEKTDSRRPSASSDDPAESLVESTGSGSRRLVWVGLGSLTVVAVSVGLLLAGSADTPAPRASAPTVDGDTDALQGQVGAVKPDAPQVRGARRAGQVTFTWTYESVQTGDTFRLQQADGKSKPLVLTKATTSLPAGASPVCVQVRVVRKTTLASDLSAVVCA